MSAEPIQAPTFDAARHLTKVSGRDYLEVKWRVVWFREDHPDGSITTELISHVNHEAVVRATVSWATDTGIVQCSDYGSEASDDFGDYLEKASTKAIGRALALAGYGTQFCEDYTFGADQQRVVDSPVDIRAARPSRSHGGRTAQAAANAKRPMNPANADEPATESQIKAIFAIGRKLNIDVKPWVAEQFGGRHIDSLTRAEASLVIEDWQSQVNQG